MVRPDGSLTDTGEILEIDPPRRMVLRWQNEWNPELKAEGPSRCTYELDPVDSAVKLTITHENRPAGVQAHHGRVRRLAEMPLQPEALAGNGGGRHHEESGARRGGKECTTW